MYYFFTISSKLRLYLLAFFIKYIFKHSQMSQYIHEEKSALKFKKLSLLFVVVTEYDVCMFLILNTRHCLTFRTQYLWGRQHKESRNSSLKQHIFGL
jgi:hypothetical protein